MQRWAALTFVILVYLLFRTPTPEYFLTDADGGVQLAAAQQIVLTGEQPHRDFIVPYGPLVYYASAFGQRVTGGRLIGEILLILCGYASSYCLLFSIARHLSGSRSVAWAILVCAMLMMPRYYKYYVILWPVAALASTAWWLRRPSRARAVAVGLVIGISFLFRADLGFFAALAAGAAILLASEHPLSVQAGNFAVVVLSGGALVASWLAMIAIGGELQQTLRDLWLSVVYSPRGIALPHPLLSWHDPGLSALYAAFFLLPAITGGMLIIRWRSLESPRRALYAATVLLAFACLTMASHRSDLAHLLQGIPVALLPVAIAFGVREPSSRKLWSVFVPTLSVAILVASTVLFLVTLWRLPPTSILRFASPRPGQVVRTMRYAVLDRQTFLEHIAEDSPAIWPLQVIRAVRASTGADDRVAIWPFWSQLVYFAERPFGGLTTVLLPGRSDLPEHQQRIVAALTRVPPSMVVWEEGYMLDLKPERQPILTHHSIHEHVRAQCREEDHVGRFAVFRCAATR